MSPQARTWGMVSHLAALSTYIGLPFGNILGPLIVWLIKKDQFPYVDRQAKEALNFNISITLYALVCGLLILAVVGVFLLLALAVFHIVFTIIAAIKANDGTLYSYPLTIRLIK